LGADVVVTLVNPGHNADMQVDCEIRGATPRQGRAEIRLALPAMSVATVTLQAG